MKSLKMRVLSNFQVSERYWHLVVDSSELNEEVNPGQFFYLRYLDEYYPFLRRPFSIYRVNNERHTIEFLYLVKGLGTKRLTEIPIGGVLDVFGPLGKGFSITESCNSILLLARGVGIATLASLAENAIKKGVRCVAILSAKTNNDLLAAETLQDIGVEIHKVTEEDGTSDVENVRKLVEHIISENDIEAVYTCGSLRLSRMLQEVANDKKIPGEIALEENMGCAMGVCFACVCNLKEGDSIKYVRICREGPVFPLEKVVLQ